MKNLIIALAFLFLSFLGVAKVHEFYVWDGYYQFGRFENDIIYVGDTIRWTPLGGIAPSMVHTITSSSIPEAAIPFDTIWSGPEIPVFEYVPQAPGTYVYVCTPHVDQWGMGDQFEVKAIVSSLGDPFTLVDFELYPSPAHDKLFIDEILIETNYSVMGNDGQIILTGMTIGEIDISELKTGVYFLLFHEDKNRGNRFYKE